MPGTRTAAGALRTAPRWTLGGWCVTWALACEAGAALWTVRTFDAGTAWSAPIWTRFAVLLAAAVGCAIVTRPRRGAPDVDQTAVFLLAGALLLPAPLAVTVLVAVRALRPKRGGWFLFTTSADVLAVLAAHGVAAATGLRAWLAAPAAAPNPGVAAGLVLAGAAAVLAYQLEETVVLGVGRALATRPDGRPAGWTAFTFRRGADGRRVSAALGTARTAGLRARTLGLGVLALLAALPLYGLLLLIVVVPLVVGDTRRERRSLAAEDAAERHRLDSLTDLKTGLANDRGFATGAAGRYTAARAAGQRVTVAVLDIDRFKRINDAYGHHAGDAVLRSLADRLRPPTAERPNPRSVFREHDFVARAGGDEFLAILPGTGADEARVVLERLRATVADTVVAHVTDVRGEDVRLTMTLSIGLAEAGPGQTLADVVQDADAAAYRSKTAGRDRVSVFTPSPEPRSSAVAFSS